MVESVGGEIAQNLARVRASVAAAAQLAGRDPGAVTLIAVSKGQPLQKITAALAAGQKVFGENRVQEAVDHWQDLRSDDDGLTLHLIGPLQTNKIGDAVALFDVIQTVDRPKLARKLAVALAAGGRTKACFIQVNTGEEPQKAGALPAEADDFIKFCRDELGLPVVGLMCIPPIEDEPALHFALLHQIAQRNDLAELSMGMSGDYETAVELGASHVRVGTAIFGARQPRPPTGGA
ncbi:MAG: YggS family pyridoxal phosphate-dependent enzyme [Alphaproteobacteria bacterium]